MFRSLNLVRGHFSVSEGSEGPRHDPYGYREYYFSGTNGIEVTLHDGLACWIDEGGKHFDYNGNESLAWDRFKVLTGLDPQEVEDLLRRKTENYIRKDREGYYQWLDMEHAYRGYE